MVTSLVVLAKLNVTTHQVCWDKEKHIKVSTHSKRSGSIKGKMYIKGKTYSKRKKVSLYSCRKQNKGRTPQKI